MPQLSDELSHLKLHFLSHLQGHAISVSSNNETYKCEIHLNHVISALRVGLILQSLGFTRFRISCETPELQATARSAGLSRPRIT